MDKKDIIKIAIIGCGRVAQHYKKIFDSGEVSGYKIVGFCDVITDRSEYFAKHFNTVSYQSIDIMIEEQKPDLVLILTPSGFHYEHSKKAIIKGCNVLCEKPISMTPNEAEEIEQLAYGSNLMYGVAFQNRFNPAIVELENAIKQNRFGKIITATIRLRWCRYQEYYEDGWHGTWSQDGGVINQQAIHHVDAINWLLGPVESVNATSTKRLNELEAEDTMVAILKFKSGALGTVEATTAARPEDFEASLSVVGEKGMALIGGIALNIIEIWNFIDPFPEDKNIPSSSSQEVETGYGLSHGPLLQKTIDRLKNNNFVAPVPANDGIETTKLIHALYESDEKKCWVKLSNNPLSNRLGK